MLGGYVGAMSLTEIVARATPAFEELTFSSPVACVYNPLTYAWDLHRQYLERFGAGTKRVVLLGMNPGPFGMVQTGVPFGEVEAVKGWMRIRGAVERPAVAYGDGLRSASGRRRSSRDVSLSTTTARSRSSERAART